MVSMMKSMFSPIWQEARCPRCSAEAREGRGGREVDAFDQQNNGAVPQYNDRNHSRDKNGFHGANSVKVTSYEEGSTPDDESFLASLCHSRSTY
ncbi:hypothetical protein REPUB_Repub13aG0256000 [Reevesia pubescens]